MSLLYGSSLCLVCLSKSNKVTIANVIPRVERQVQDIANIVNMFQEHTKSELRVSTMTCDMHWHSDTAMSDYTLSGSTAEEVNST